MRRVRLRPVPLLVWLLIALCGSACGGRRFYPVRGQVLVDGKPAHGVTIIFHPLSDADPHPVQPSAIVEADGSFELHSYVVQDRALKDGAPPGPYQVSCIWYPPDLQQYLGRMENLPDKLQGKYADPKKSGLRAEVQEGPTELPPFELKLQKK